MKKFLILIVSALFAFNLSAVSDTSLLQSDETQKTYQRKAVMGLGSIGFTQNSVNVPMAFCHIDNSKKVQSACIPWTVKINYPIGSGEKRKAAGTFYDWTITNRYDKIVLNENEASITTRGQKTSVKTEGRIPAFSSGPEDLEAYTAKVENYLNGEARSYFGALLDSALEARYSELPEKEQETFMVTKAKELGMSAEFIKPLLNSSFVFAAHVSHIGTSGRVTSVTTKVKNVVLTSFSVEMNVGVDVTFLIYRYNPETRRFERYNTIQASSGMVTSETPALPVLPTRELVLSLFNDALQTAIKGASINASNKLKADENFALYAPVKSVNGSKLEINMGVVEDIRVDHPFTIYEKADGKMKKKGTARARNIANNCKDDTKTTTLQKITGKVEEADLIEETPWSGLYFYIGPANNAARLSSKIGMFAAPGFHLGTSIDLGYAANSRALSEFYFDAFLSFDVKIEGEDIDNHLSIGGGIGLSKRFYTGSGGFFFGLGGLISYNGDIMSDWQYLALTPHIQLGFTPSSSFDFIIKAGWNLGVTVIDNESDDYEQHTFNHGLYLSLDFNFQIPVIGGMARMYSKPSKACELKK
ncbi:hypothetical protein J6Z39_03725 [bacterium]|nr:hypothetical protein [bacterium]